MKILFVQKEGGIFGAENYQLNVIPGLQTKGVQVDFLRLYTNHQGGRGGAFINKLCELKVKTFEINIGRLPKLNALIKIRSVVQNGGYDIVHTHLIHADFYLALVKTLLKMTPVLVSTKHGYDNSFTSRFGFDAKKQKRTLYFLVSRWAEKRMKSSFTISNGLKDFFLATGLSSSDKMGLIYYGFDLPDNHLKKGKETYRFSNYQIIIAGRLIPFKGHVFLINALAKVVDNFQDVILVVAGSGPLEESLKGHVKELGLENNVKFLGYTQDVGAFMANSDVVVIPSKSEGFGVVFLEAFSAKSPVVAWNVPAGNELIDHNKSGYLVPPYDETELAQRLIDILSNPEAQKPIVEAAYQRLKTNFNLNTMVDETILFYESALKK
ncbi:MAG TPA: glycosyltransferase family 4 protein [Roseivirga sp.]